MGNGVSRQPRLHSYAKWRRRRVVVYLGRPQANSFGLGGPKSQLFVCGGVKSVVRGLGRNERWKWSSFSVISAHRRVISVRLFQVGFPPPQATQSKAPQGNHAPGNAFEISPNTFIRRKRCNHFVPLSVSLCIHLKRILLLRKVLLDHPRT